MPHTVGRPGPGALFAPRFSGALLLSWLPEPSVGGEDDGGVMRSYTERKSAMPTLPRLATNRFVLTSLMLSFTLVATAGGAVAAPPGSRTNWALLAAAIPQAAYGVRGALNAGFVAFYGPYYEQSGALLSLQMTYTPAAATVQLGLCTDATFGSCFNWQPIPSGGGGAAWQVTQTGNFYLAVWNQGSGTIDYTGTLQA